MPIFYLLNQYSHPVLSRDVVYDSVGLPALSKIDAHRSVKFHYIIMSAEYQLYISKKEALFAILIETDC